MKLNQLETPALVADLDIIEKNMETMKTILSGSILRLRPHFKSHKCAALAHKQMEMGAVGITCAKISEAEDLCDSGIDNILIANQIVDPEKIARLARLAGKCSLTVCADEERNLRMLSRAAESAGTVIHILVEYDIGMSRCGVTDPETYVKLARLAGNLPGLSYEGIQAYAGHVSHMLTSEERKAATDRNGEQIRSLVRLLEENGIAVNTISGGSTGTAVLKAAQGLYTELQAGSYFFMDATYGNLDIPFENSLFLIATVCSKREGLTVLDAGVKSLGMDQGNPLCLTMDGTRVLCDRMDINEEHLKLFGPQKNLAIGEKVLLIPGHCCSTVNLHDKIYLFRGGQIVDRLPVTSRGHSV